MKTKLITAAVAILVLLLGVQTWRLNKEEQAHAKTSMAFSTYIAEQFAYNTTESKRRADDIEQIRREGDEKLNEVQAMLDRTANDLNGLRSENTRLRTARNPTAASQCKTEYERIRVLTGLLDECAAKYTAVAGAAQRSRISGLMCEKSYDALISKR